MTTENAGAPGPGATEGHLMVKAAVDAFLAAYEARDVDALKALITPRGLSAQGGVFAFIDESLHRGNVLAFANEVTMAFDGRRAIAHMSFQRPPRPARGFRLLMELAPDGSWRIVAASNTVALDAAFLERFYDGVAGFADLPLSANLIRRAQRLVDALETGADLGPALGDTGEGAQMALMMLKGQVKAGQRVTVLPAREHPVVTRGAIGLSIMDPGASFGSEFWLLCHSDGDDFEVLASSSFVELGMLLAPHGGRKLSLRTHPIDTDAGQPVPGDAFERAIRKALEGAVTEHGQSEGVEDAFDRAVRGHMASDDAARSRFQALFETLAEDRREALLKQAMRGRGEGAGTMTLDSLWQNNDFVGALRQAVADYIAPHATDGKPVEVNADFMRSHGEGLVGAVFAAIFKPVADNLSPDKLIGGGD